MANPTDDARVGTLVAGRYQLGDPIGRGGVGVVYAAVDTQSAARVAVKLLNPQHAGNADVTRRFLKEARTAGSLADPHVIGVLDAGTEADGRVYLVLEFLEGESLATRLRRRRSMPVSEVLPLLLPLFETLASAHRGGIVHRDLKPDNIFVCREANGDEILKLLDFGIAKMLESEQQATQAGIVLGTPHYMSPEQAVGAPDVGPQADVWAMGVVLYECLSGAMPYRIGDDSEVLDAIINDSPFPLTERAPPGVPRALAAAIDGALVRDRSQRYRTMHAFRAAVLSAAGTLATPGASADATARLPSIGGAGVRGSVRARSRRLVWAGQDRHSMLRVVGRRASIAVGVVACIAVIALAGWIKARHVVPARASAQARPRVTPGAAAPRPVAHETARVAHSSSAGQPHRQTARTQARTQHSARARTAARAESHSRVRQRHHHRARTSGRR